MKMFHHVHNHANNNSNIAFVAEFDFETCEFGRRISKNPIALTMIGLVNKTDGCSLAEEVTNMFGLSSMKFALPNNMCGVLMQQ